MLVKKMTFLEVFTQKLQHEEIKRKRHVEEFVLAAILEGHTIPQDIRLLGDSCTSIQLILYIVVVNSATSPSRFSLGSLVGLDCRQMRVHWNLEFRSSDKRLTTWLENNGDARTRTSS